MKKISKTAFFALVFLLIEMTGYAQPQSPLTTQVNGRIEQSVRQEDYQGAILIAQQGRVIFDSAYGFADIEHKRLNTTETQFFIGSLTKSFTATAIMRLVEQNKLDLHAPVKNYVPELKPELSEDLTLHLLLKHQSGLVQHLERITEFENKDVSSQEILAIINQSQRLFKPGEQYQYGNLNYHLLALAIEKVTQQSYTEAMRALVFEPLQMNSSGVERIRNPALRRAKGYRKDLLGMSHAENIVSYALGSGDIYSTTKDLLRWDQALYREDFLSKQSIALLFSPETEAKGNYGYGFRIQPYQRKSAQDHGILTRHGGSMNGFLANLHRYTDDKLTVIVLGNIRPFPIRDLTFDLKEIALGFAPGERKRRPVE